MSGRPSRESVLSTLFATLVGSIATEFTAGTLANSPVLQNPSSTEDLFLGLPVVGGSIPRGAIVASLSPLTLSLAPTANAASVSLSSGFLTTGRRLLKWTDVSSQPALFLRSEDEESEWPQGPLQTLTLRAEAYIYSNAGANPDVVPETMLNNLLDAIDAAMAPDNAQSRLFTLGGLVAWCRIVGRIEKDTGDLDGQAMARVPIEILVP
jgi:hypothetical protein